MFKVNKFKARPIIVDTITNKYREQKIFCAQDDKKENIFYLVLEYRYAPIGKWGGNYYMECLVYDLASKKIIKKVISKNNKEQITSNKIYYSENFLIFERGGEKKLMKWNIVKNEITSIALWDYSDSKHYQARSHLASSNDTLVYHCSYALRGKMEFNYLFKVNPNPSRNRCSVECAYIKKDALYHIWIHSKPFDKITLLNETVRSCWFADNDLFTFSTVNNKTGTNDQIIWSGYKDCDLHKKYFNREFEINGTYKYHYFFPKQALLLIGYQGFKTFEQKFYVAIYSFN